MKWVAFFSQTGAEIADIIRHTGLAPNMIVTNNLNEETWHPDIRNSTEIVLSAPSSSINTWLMNLDPTFITLHGYLRIIPAEVCERHEILNGHPGDIVTYPQLKGKDPQEKSLKLELPSTGVVIHRAVGEVDAGEILASKTYVIQPGTTINQLISDLRSIQLDEWCKILGARL